MKEIKLTQGMDKINFLDFVKKFDEKEKAKDYTYYSTDFFGIYTIDKDEKGNYQIISLDNFSIVCELPVWLNRLLLVIEGKGVKEIQKKIKTALGIG